MVVIQVSFAALEQQFLNYVQFLAKLLPEKVACVSHYIETVEYFR